MILFCYRNISYKCYRFGIVLKELDLKQEAIEILVQSLEKEPILWTSWIEIASLCNTKEEVWGLFTERCFK